jgi:hypothetical protein
VLAPRVRRSRCLLPAEAASAEFATTLVATRETDFSASLFVVLMPGAKKSVTESRVVLA